MGQSWVLGKGALVHAQDTHWFAIAEVVKPASCWDKADGILEVVVIGGKGHFAIAGNFSGRVQDMRILDVAPGPVDLIIKDAYGFSRELRVQVPVIPKPAIRTEVLADDWGQAPAQGMARISIEGSAAGNYTYEWHGLPHQRGPLAKGLQPGLQLVTVTDPLGCQSLEGISIVDQSAGRDPWADGAATGGAMANLKAHPTPFAVMDIQMYPNPNTGRFFMLVPADVAESYSLKVFNTAGQVVYQTHATAGFEAGIQLEGVSPGIYTVQVTLDDGSVFAGKTQIR